MRDVVVEKFVQRFGEAPTWVARAPGRVNLIGEHTDYNDGFVLPMAIDRAIWIALRARPDDVVDVYSADFDEPLQFSLHDDAVTTTGWLRYVQGMALSLKGAGFALHGWEGVTVGNVPIGAGLSSSAAFELAAARAFEAVSGLAWNAREFALLAQRAENVYVGVNCGIMDQMISASGQAGCALLIDCRTLAARPVPLPAGTRVAIMDTATRRGLVDSAYNERRSACEAAARILGVKALRDVDSETLMQRAGELDAMTLRRARHVVTENERTLKAAIALEAGDAAEMGRLMDASHESLRDDFEVSTNELNQMVALARAHAGCFGARMTGAGFGGCAVALIRETAADDFVATVSEQYRSHTGLDPALYVSMPAAGATVSS